MINSVAARKDPRSVAKLKELAARKDAEIASAALWALGNIASPEAIAFVEQQAGRWATPCPWVRPPLLRCADASAAGAREAARPIYDQVGRAGQVKGVRRAARARILRLQKEHTTETILSWIGGADTDRRLVAVGRLTALSDAELDRWRTAGRIARGKPEGLIEVMALQGKGRPAAGRVGGSKRTIGLLGWPGSACWDKSATLRPLRSLDSLAAGGRIAEAAQQALCELPRKAAEPAWSPR